MKNLSVIRRFFFSLHIMGRYVSEIEVYIFKLSSWSGYPSRRSRYRVNIELGFRFTSGFVPLLRSTSPERHI